MDNHHGASAQAEGPFVPELTFVIDGPVIIREHELALDVFIPKMEQHPHDFAFFASLCKRRPVRPGGTQYELTGVARGAHRFASDQIIKLTRGIPVDTGRCLAFLRLPTPKAITYDRKRAVKLQGRDAPFSEERQLNTQIALIYDCPQGLSQVRLGGDFPFSPDEVLGRGFMALATAPEGHVGLSHRRETFAELVTIVPGLDLALVVDDSGTRAGQDCVLQNQYCGLQNLLGLDDGPGWLRLMQPAGSGQSECDPLVGS